MLFRGDRARPGLAVRRLHDHQPRAGAPPSRFPVPGERPRRATTDNQHQPAGRRRITTTRRGTPLHMRADPRPRTVNTAAAASQEGDRMHNTRLCTAVTAASPRCRAAPNGGSVRVLPTSPVAQRHAVDRRDLEADLPPVRCDRSAGGLRGSLAEVPHRGGTPAARPYHARAGARYAAEVDIHPKSDDA